ncbi:MAG: YgjV family protein [Erysipelotrichaceae bacterium]|nr:YgjV family protein [Erysipelotrichaceae bacterium]
MSNPRTLLIANAITLLAQFVNLYASTRKSKKDILIWQCCFMALVGGASWLLKGYSAVVTDILGIIRNLIIIKGIENRTVDIIQIILCIVLGVYFNNNALLGYLPIIASISQSLLLLNRNARTRHVQMVCAFSSFCWAGFNIGIGSYVGAVFNTLAAVSYLLTMFRSSDNA